MGSARPRCCGRRRGPEDRERYLGPTSGWTLAPLLLDDGMALVATRDGAPVALIRVLVADGLVTAIRTVLLP